MVTNVVLAMGIMMIPVGFLLETTPAVSKLWIWACGIIGFACIIIALVRSDKEDTKKDKQHQELLDAINNVNKKSS
jgi:hypothetical protein